jgi:hypothetical protein
MSTSETPKPKYSVTYWINRTEQIALVRISDTVVQGWQAKGNKFSEDFRHSHFQTTYPSKERLDESLQKFESSTIEQYLDIQFRHHQYDDHFRDKANEIKDKLYQQQQKATAS